MGCAERCRNRRRRNALATLRIGFENSRPLRQPLTRSAPATIGSTIEANFVRFDRRRGLAVLSVSGARREIFWENVQPGIIVEGTVSATNKGGLTVDIKGHRAFLPISQIEMTRVENLDPYVGKKIVCEITSVDRADEDIVLSRRNILEREAEEKRGKALTRLVEGEVLTGTITRLNQHGAFVDLGGVEGLLHTSKIRAHQNEIGGDDELHVGRQLVVEIMRVDRELQRVGLDFHRVAADTWALSIEGYEVGDEVTGWISKITAEGAWLSIDEGVEGIVPTALVDDDVHQGNIVRAAITSIDRDARRVELKPIDR